MSLFDTDIVTKDICVPIKTRLLIDVETMVQQHHRDLIATQRTRGHEGVVWLLYMYMNSIRHRPEYSHIATNIPHSQDWDPYSYLYDDPPLSERMGCVTWIKGDYYIVINILSDPLMDSDRRDNGQVIVILDQYMRVKKSKTINGFFNVIN